MLCAAFLLIYILIYFWPYTVGALLIWAIVTYLKRASARETLAAPVRAKSKAAPIKAVANPKPTRAGELPAPDYLRRWSTGRRQDVCRDRDEWQKAFDRITG